MTRADMVKLVSAVAALVGVVALVSPPTRPVPTPAGDWREQLPVKTGTPPPAPSATPVPATAFARPPALAGRRMEADASDAEQPAQPAAAPYREERDPADDLAARRFRQGYRWAERNGIDDERDCYRDPGDPFADGCLAALTNADRRYGYRERLWESPWGR